MHVTILCHSYTQSDVPVSIRSQPICWRDVTMEELLQILEAVPWVKRQNLFMHGCTPSYCTINVKTFYVPLVLK
jgi:hypothetical protein